MNAAQAKTLRKLWPWWQPKLLLYMLLKSDLPSMNFDLKGAILGLATSDQGKDIAASLIEEMAKNSDNAVDDAMAAGVRAALFYKEED